MIQIIRKIYHFYCEGFANMRLGRTLWAVIAIKLFIIFVILKLFFFPNFIRQNTTEGCEADYVSTQLTDR
ncbi:MAG: DUF4492 domain-containing protein [Prevotella sp.]